MHKLVLCLLATNIFFSSMPIRAQSYVGFDMVGQAAGDAARNRRSNPPNACYDGRWNTNPASFASADRRSELAMADYLQFSAAGRASDAFIKNNERVKLDGTEMAPPLQGDPWRTKVARIERISLIVGHANNRYRGQWKAVAADGRTLGTYDALLQRAKDRARLLRLEVYTPASKVQPAPMIPFCDQLGDIEKWKQDKAERDSVRSAERAR